MNLSTFPVLTGRRLGAYEVQDPIGSGAMGVVYRALDTRLNRPVAIKFLSRRRRRRRGARADFSRKRRRPRPSTIPTSSRCSKPASGRTAHYLVTELLDGGTLKEWAGRRTAHLAPDRRSAGRRRRRPGGGARGRHPAPRHQAGEHPGHQERLRQARRFRTGEAGGAGG